MLVLFILMHHFSPDAKAKRTMNAGIKLSHMAKRFQVLDCAATFDYRGVSQGFLPLKNISFDQLFNYFCCVYKRLNFVLIRIEKLKKFNQLDAVATFPTLLIFYFFFNLLLALLAYRRCSPPLRLPFTLCPPPTTCRSHFATAHCSPFALRPHFAACDRTPLAIRCSLFALCPLLELHPLSCRSSSYRLLAVGQEEKTRGGKSYTPAAPARHRPSHPRKLARLVSLLPHEKASRQALLLPHEREPRVNTVAAFTLSNFTIVLPLAPPNGPIYQVCQIQALGLFELWYLGQTTLILHLLNLSQVGALVSTVVKLIVQGLRDLGSECCLLSDKMTLLWGMRTGAKKNLLKECGWVGKVS